jgi:hypothetical protein
MPQLLNCTGQTTCCLACVGIKCLAIVNRVVFKCMLVSVCMVLLESATFALGDEDATRRTIQTQTDLIRHRRHTAGQTTAAKRGGTRPRRMSGTSSLPAKERLL